VLFVVEEADEELQIELGKNGCFSRKQAGRKNSLCCFSAVFSKPLKSQYTQFNFSTRRKAARFT